MGRVGLVCFGRCKRGRVGVLAYVLVSGWEKPDSDKKARTVPTPLVVDGGWDGDAPPLKTLL